MSAPNLVAATHRYQRSKIGLVNNVGVLVIGPAGSGALFETPAEHQLYVRSIFVSNVSTTAPGKITCTITDGLSNVVRMPKDLSISVSTKLRNLLGGAVWHLTDDMYLELKSDVDNVLEFMVTFEELDADA